MRHEGMGHELGGGIGSRAALAVVALFILAQAGVVQGQDSAAALTGRRVRIVTTSKAQTGLLVGATADTLTVRADKSGALTEVPRASVTDLRVSRGFRRQTLYGLLGGAAAWGVVVGVVAATGTLDESGVGEPAFIAGLLAGGAAIGSLVKRERWEPVPGRDLALRLAPERRGVSLRLALAF